MGFKESLEDDLDRVFFNTNEFADKYQWNTKEITAVVDDDSLIRKYSSEFEALGQGGRMVFVSEKQFTTLPIMNEVVVFDYNTYTIDEVKTDAGMLCIFLRMGRG